MAMTEVQAPQKIVDYITEGWGFGMYDLEAEEQIYEFLYDKCPEVDIWSIWFNEDTYTLNIIAEFEDAEKATWWILKWAE